MNFTKKIILFLATILCNNIIYAQLDSIHYLPPLHAYSSGQVEDHYAYLSTPELTPFDVTITDGAGNLQAVATISSTQSYKHFIGNGQVPATKMLLPIDSLNTILKSSGLIFSALKKFYVNFRVRSSNQAEVITTKGLTAAGNSFRVGHFPIISQTGARSFVASFMATENNTTLTIDDYDPNVVFSGTPYVFSNTINVNLNKGECYVVSGYRDTIANLSGFLGARVVANKPIIMNSGNMNGTMGNDGGQDICLDQAVPISSAGKNFITIEGKGQADVERPLVVGLFDSTKVFINGSTTPTTTVNAGDWFIIPNSNYQGTNHKNMYIKTSKPSYIYQGLGGGSTEATSGMNFIPPFNCFLPQEVDFIPSVDSIGSTAYSGGITIFTEAGAVVEVNNIVQNNPEPVLGAPWETYQILNINGDIKITSTNAMAAGIFGSSGAAGYAGYFSGFATNFTPNIDSIGSCMPLTLYNTNSLEVDSVKWYFNNNEIPNSNTDTILINQPGNYNIVVFQGSCTDTSDTFLVSLQELTVSIQQTQNISCNGSSDGVVSAIPSGGNSPYSYNWNNSATTDSITNLGPGTYTVTVTDAKGCTIIDSLSITEPTILQATAVVDSLVKCFGENNGGASVSASGGTTPYTYAWSNSSTNTTIENLAAGLYTITVSDDNGCTALDTVEITQPDTLTSTVTLSSQILCNGDANGKIYVTASGGSNPYNYLWNNSSTNDTINNLTASNYTITVTDSNGCTSTTSYVLTEPLALSVSLNVDSNERCNNFSDGGASSLVSGGTSPYSYSWVTSDTTSFIANVTGGTYTVTITDANGCTIVDSITISTNPPPDATFTGLLSTYCVSDTAVTLTPNFGGGSFFGPGITGNQFNPNTAGLGTHQIKYVVANNDGCTDSTIQTVIVTEQFDATIATIDPICITDSIIQLNAASTNGIWVGNGILDSIAGSFSVNAAGFGTHQIVYAINGACGDTDTIFITVHELPTAEAGEDKVIHLGESIQVSASGGASYSWSPSIGLSCDDCSNPNVTPNITTTYYVTVTNENGCTSVDSLTITVNELNGELFIPNIFSPNGDGNNDIIYVYGDNIAKMEFDVYNRWGQKIFSSNSQDVGWDGTFKGETLDPAVFAYGLYVEFTNGQSEIRKGNITLIK